MMNIQLVAHTERWYFKTPFKKTFVIEFYYKLGTPVLEVTHYSVIDDSDNKVLRHKEYDGRTGKQAAQSLLINFSNGR